VIRRFLGGLWGPARLHVAQTDGKMEKRRGAHLSTLLMLAERSELGTADRNLHQLLGSTGGRPGCGMGPLIPQVVPAPCPVLAAGLQALLSLEDLSCSRWSCQVQVGFLPESTQTACSFAVTLSF